MIYLPMTCDILTVGHLKCIELLNKKGDVIIGVLTDKALEGYKTPVVPYEDRHYILDTVARSFARVIAVRQDSLDPSLNLKRYGCKFIASGDGWEKEELDAMAKLRVKPIDIVIPGEDGKAYSSSSIKEKIKLS